MRHDRCRGHCDALSLAARSTIEHDAEDGVILSIFPHALMPCCSWRSSRYAFSFFSILHMRIHARLIWREHYETKNVRRRIRSRGVGKRRENTILATPACCLRRNCVSHECMRQRIPTKEEIVVPVINLCFTEWRLD